MSNVATVWIVDDDTSIRWVLEKSLTTALVNTRAFDSADKLIEQLKKQQPDVIVSDIRMPGTDGLQLLEYLKQRFPKIPTVIMTAHSDLDSAVASYQGGAFEYLPKPFDIDDAVAIVDRAIAFSSELSGEKATELVLQSTEIIGESPAMQEVFRAIGRLAKSNITVLINGESGTGKELVAHALHHHSPRNKREFIALNMAAIPKDLIESELFGHEKGAFTGANSARRGRFEQADGGTLFLDEIGDMPAQAQTRLLRVLADAEFYRVGGHTSVKVDVRIITATHQNLEALVEQGKFREDLFHRLNVIRIHLPTLAARRGDIIKLAKHFLHSAAKELEVEVKTLSAEAEQFFQSLPWPGNVRQLENTCRWLTVMCAGREILQIDMPPELKLEQQQVSVEGAGVVGDWQQLLAIWMQEQLNAGQTSLLDIALPCFETVAIKAALNHSGGRKQEAAKLLGWGRNTLTRKLKELELKD
ncbi:nitrogen regulation protein NR(I) ['Osedax' symbiont bacterium Rs2_46_30_T18]|nr:nitrogen regulation protein NR(I) ['Osedax' symbiont bacterium Rs2_46_30_T18]